MIDRYIEMRNSGKYNLEWFYEYYNSKDGKEIDISKFNMVFNMVNLNQILEDLDKEFNLTQVLDHKGKLIKVYKNE